MGKSVPIWIALIAGFIAVRIWSELGVSPGNQAGFEVTASCPVQQYMQLFYSTTEHPGVSEEFSVRVPLNSTRPEKYLFRLPPGRYTAFRLDPMVGPAVVTLREVRVVAADGKTELARLDPATWTPNNDVTTFKVTGNGAEVTAAMGHEDAFLLMPLAAPVEIGPKNGGPLVGAAAFAGACGFVLIIAALLQPGRQLSGLGRAVEAVLSRLVAGATRLVPVDVLPLDRVAVGFLLAVAGVCLVAAMAGLHGSSTTVRGVGTYFPQDNSAPILGTPKGVRADEWAFHTPLILNQTQRQQPLALDGGAGPGAAVLVANLPVRHWTMVFRPQFWSFLVLSPAKAFAFYWQAKAFLLLTGTFLLFLLLTRSSGCAVLGAAWFYFSAFTQWGFSWPALLPEMIGLIALGVVLVALLFVAPSRRHLAGYALLLVPVAVNFSLCAYPPFQVPLVWAGAGLGVAWIAGQNFSTSSRPRWIPAGVALAAALGVVAVVMVLFLREMRPVVDIVANTVYPGKRSFAGGSVSWEWFASSFLDWAKGETRVPPSFSNVCEGTGFLWLAPVLLLLPGRTDRRGTVTMAVLFLPSLLLAAWMTLPIPAAWGHWLLLDMVQPGRVTPALGLLNIALVATFLGSRAGATALGWSWRTVALLVVPLAGMFGCLWAMNVKLGKFFTTPELWIAAALVALAVIALALGRRAMFAAIVLGPLVWANAFINPVDRGFAAYERPALRRFIDEHRLRDGRWLIVSNDFSMPQYFVALGLDVFNSFKFVPALDDWSRLDPGGQGRGTYNQSGEALAYLLPAGSPPRFGPLPFPGLPANIWHLGVDPADRNLAAVGVRYFALPGAPRPDLFAAADFELLTPEPVNGFTIYRRR